MLYCTDRNDAGKNPGWNIRDRRRFVVRQERFKMERQGLVEEGQQVEVTERSPNTNLFTYVVEPAVAIYFLM